MSNSSSSGRTVPASETPAAFWPDLSLLGVALIWGINMPIMKTGLDQLNPFVFNALRLIISAGCLSAFALRERRQGNLPAADMNWSRILPFAIVIAGLYQILFLTGIDRTTAGNTGLIMATVPAWTALLAHCFIGDRLSRTAWCGLCLALCGTLIVALQKGDVSGGREHLTGNLIVLCAALAWASGTVYSRPLLESISPMQLSATAALMALPVHLLIAGLQFPVEISVLRTAPLWLILAWAGLLSSGLSLPMWNYGVRHAGPAHAAAVQNLIPLVAIAAAWMTRSEAPTGRQVVGGSLILSGLLIMRMARTLTRND